MAGSFCSRSVKSEDGVLGSLGIILKNEFLNPVESSISRVLLTLDEGFENMSKRRMRWTRCETV